MAWAIVWRKLPAPKWDRHGGMLRGNYSLHIRSHRRLSIRTDQRLPNLTD